MNIEYTVKDHIATFTIDNGRLNLLTMAMHEKLYRFFLNFLEDDDAKVGILVGKGENFSAGDDLKESDTDIKGRDKPRWDELIIAHRRTKPIISAINGYCFGQGIIYALLLSDIRIGGPAVKLGFPEIAYGMGGISGVTRLAACIPYVHAAYLALTGEKITGQQAKEWQILNEIVENPLERATQIAATIAQHPLIAIQTELDGLHRGQELSRSEAFAYARQQYMIQRKLHLASGHTALGDLNNQLK